MRGLPAGGACIIAASIAPAAWRHAAIRRASRELLSRKINSWPLLQHARSLPDRQSNPRPELNGACEYLACSIEIIAAVEQAIELRAVLGPLLDFVKVAIIRVQRVVGFFV
jgi:hypothetical protein